MVEVAGFSGIHSEADPHYIKLTSLLHWKSDSNTIKQRELDAIFNALFSESGSSGNDDKPVIKVLLEAADECLNDAEGINFENKIVLSIAIRLCTEEFVIKQINDQAFVNAIQSNQTYVLFKRFKETFPAKDREFEILQRVLLMTPESIHVNSFMYEPILDMSDGHLRKLLTDVLSLTNGAATR